jgi:hypothetical protein
MYQEGMKLKVIVTSMISEPRISDDEQDLNSLGMDSAGVVCEQEASERGDSFAERIAPITSPS